MSDSVTATIRYVQRDNNNRLASEKPYILHYEAPPGFPQNNFAIQPYTGIQVRNLRTAPNISYQENGMLLASLGDEASHSMRPEDFDDDTWIERVYLLILHKCLCKVLGAQDVTVFDWMLRKRAPSFPKRSDDGNGEDVQPSLSAHVAELEGRLDSYFGKNKERLLSRRYQVINIWKPLSGPCRDYPMAYLDPKTVDREKDLFAVDEVFPTVANEVYQVYHSPSHNWYYVPDQLASEIVIFNAYDSERDQDQAVPHCSFDLGERGSGIPRQSIEVRAFVFY
ncbi:hypothetical protein B0T25DRAFT_575754 [Lasiosphaeria hispida]|uniref:Methyltransferase n=1 Tax=Lasiosphaeria hispida TaxID=260671 RepID=A0AAJ0HUT4_9PEZI|nr:hypothetical protein B0T25DRAFT_575754 [Lasiosphaeria hispida]